jgi:hypothetical protein
MARKRIAIGIILAVMVSVPTSLLACSCVTVGTGEFDYRQTAKDSAAVFRGTVVEVLQLQSVALQMVVVDADAAWAGIKSRRVYVFTGYGGGDCGYPFEVGKQYIVWANRNEEWAPGELSTGICSFTTPLEAASEQLRQLGKPRKLKE